MKNTLKNEKSSYLLQHKDNPVAWQPWSAETLSMAKEHNKPLFISIGYSSCHWCHVMAHESFESEDAAAIINAHFIPVKVDREEFPDVDKYYQSFLQASRQQGGWPLSIFAFPDGSPFYGGTYFPNTAKHGLPAFNTLLSKLADIYQNDTDNLKTPANSFETFKDTIKSVKYTQEHLDKLNEETILDEFMKNADLENGGLKGQTKFPNIPVLLFLLEQFNDCDEVMTFLNKTAEQLCTSGLYDHIRGGFYRYTVDQKWDVPHFEKMLYDNALNSIFLTRMFEATDNMLYFSTVQRTLDFLISEMNCEYGMFASMDADSFDENNTLSEGHFYKIHNTDIDEMSESDTKLLASFAQFNDNVLRFSDISYESYQKLLPIFEQIEKKQTKNKVKPFTDEKIITSWNMLACYALLEYAEIANEDFYYQQAVELFHKIRTFMLADGKVFRVNYEETVSKHRTLEDAAFTLFTLTKLFEMTKEKQFLKIAEQIISASFDSFYKEGILYLDTDKQIMDTFDDAVFSPFNLMIKSIIFFKDYMDIDIPEELKDFSVDRALKFTIAHPTLLSALLI